MVNFGPCKKEDDALKHTFKIFNKRNQVCLNTGVFVNRDYIIPDYT